MSDKIKKEIFNGVGENVRALAQLFPSAVKDGEVDIEALRQELGEFVEVGAEKYDFTWNGKAKAKAEANSDILGRTLKLKPGEGVNEDTTQNLYIEGDNLEALKLLRNSYYNKIKMIYIDPPYNTGNDFVYRDNFNMTEEEKQAMAEDLGEVDDEGNRLVKNSSDSSKYHTNWLNMMYPRLKIAKELLTDDGVIFISIDDNEQANLKKLCDEVFGENNFINSICVETSGGLFGLKAKFASSTIVKTKDYVVIYSKTNSNYIYSPLYTKSKKNFDTHFTFYKKGDIELPLNDFLQTCELLNIRSISVGLKNNVENLHLLMSMFNDVYDFIYSEANNIYRIRDYTLNLTNEDKNKLNTGKKELIGDVYVFMSIDHQPLYLYPFSQLVKKSDDYDSKLCSCVLQGDLWKGFNEDMGNIGKEGDVKFENGKKPVRLIKNIVKFMNDKNTIVLDFFSGSATTAHAVMQLNAEDGGNRKFIMVQLDENLEISCSKAIGETKNGIKENIRFLESINKPAILSELGKERIRRAGKKIAEENQMTAPNLDIGFKVLKVADTNIKMFSNEIEDKELSIENYLGDDQEAIDFNAGYTDIDVCYELLLRHRGIPLSSKVGKLPIGERTYIIADSIVVCLDKQVAESLVEQLAAIDPLPNKYIFRDSSFGDDISLKENTMIHLQAIIEKNSGASKKTYTVEFI